MSNMLAMPIGYWRKHKDIVSILLPEALCLLGAKCSYIAIAWWLLNGQATPLEFALILAATEFIETFAAPLLAPIVDRWGAAKVVKVSSSVSLAASMFLLAGYGYATPSILLFLLPASLSMMALSSAVRNPAVQAYISQRINPENITTCVAARTSVSSLITIAGPAIGGILTWLGGTLSVLIVETTCYIVATVLFYFLWRVESGIGQPRNLSNKSSYLSDLVGGIAAIFHVRTELGIGALSAGINFVVSPFFSIVVPAYVVFSGGSFNAAHLGIIDSSFGVGILVGAAVFMPLLTRWIGKFACLFVGYLILASSLIVFSKTGNPTWCAVAVLVGGITMPLINTHLGTLRLIATPQEFVGRMVGGIAGLCTVAIPLGTTVSGAALQIMQPESVVFLQGMLILALSPLLFAIPNLRHLLRLPEESLVNAYRTLYPKAFADRSK